MSTPFQQMGLIGCGLMGGSLALALKAAGQVRSVVGFSATPASSAKALQLGVIEQQVLQLEQVVTGSDLIVLAMPVLATNQVLQRIQTSLSRDALVIDVGSTKLDVVAAASLALADKAGQFVGCHPMAGAEKAGVENASARLYERCQVIMTPTAQSKAHHIAQAQALWEALGCKVVHMTPQAHDSALAKVSHLPHLLAFAYLNGLLNGPEPEQALALAGTGFKDFSRIAASEPHMWRDIFLANQQALLDSLSDFEWALQQIKDDLRQGRVLEMLDKLSRASQARSKWQITRAVSAGSTQTPNP